MRKYILIKLLLLSFMSSGQVSTDKLFDHYKIADSKLKTFEIHVTKSKSSIKKPLLIYIDASGNFPLYYKAKSGKYSTSISLDIAKYSKDYYVVLISKPNTPFSDTLQYSQSGRKFYPENNTYNELYSLDWRAETASKAIDFLTKKLPIDRKKINVMNYSEGAQVAPKIAVINKKVTNIVCFVGNVQNHL